MEDDDESTVKFEHTDWGNRLADKLASTKKAKGIPKIGKPRYEGNDSIISLKTQVSTSRLLNRSIANKSNFTNAIENSKHEVEESKFDNSTKEEVIDLNPNETTELIEKELYLITKQIWDSRNELLK